ncbi:hypothetical protein Lalb_Chr21g0307151 [Lupinus albus]|uniref:Plant self-incompatibility S1 n=1 Tax=Lupinus albus TaxID=3870 RepID=A0A6A4NIG0_LUPAL|nr:hypothetical protein Lalb_Chr21g0307151 [Lupinus albus]
MCSSNKGRVLLLLLVLACLNSSPNHEAEAINILSIVIHNNLPSGSQFYFTSDLVKDKYFLQPGQTFGKLANFEARDCTMVYNYVCAKLFLYDPKTDSGHNKVFWSVRKDGIYRSWDDSNWEKKTGWDSTC